MNTLWAHLCLMSIQYFTSIIVNDVVIFFVCVCVFLLQVWLTWSLSWKSFECPSQRLKLIGCQRVER